MMGARKSGKPRWFTMIFAGFLTFSLLLVACGDDGDSAGNDDGGNDAAEQEPVSITIHDTAGVPAAFPSFAVEKGFFEERGLDVTVEPVQGGTSSVPALQAGEIQLAGSNSTSVLVGLNEGLVLKAIASSTVSHPEGEEDFAGLLVAEDSEIQSKMDLEGKTIAVNALASLPGLAVRTTLAEAGVDLDKVELTEVPFPEMGAALERGDVDAISAIEPFQTMAIASGARVLYYHFSEMIPEVQVGIYVTTEEYAQENADTVQAMSEALSQNATYIAENPDEFREFLVSYADMEPELADNLVLPVWNEEVDFESLEELAQLMQEAGVTDEVVDISQLML